MPFFGTNGDHKGDPLVIFLLSIACGIPWWGSIIVAALGWFIYGLIYSSDLAVKASNNTVNPVNLPERGTERSAGLDLKYAGEQAKTIEPGKRKRFTTGLMMEIPSGYCGFIKTRSSLALKYIDVKGGVIDSDYRGVVDVILHNSGDKPYTLEPGEKIAQLVIFKYGALNPFFTRSLKETDRGQGGFGSTNAKKKE